MSADVGARRLWPSFDDLPVSRRFVAGFLALVVCALGWLSWSWLRDSSLVRVSEVRVTGLTTRDAPAIRRTLREASMRMTTLHYSADELERAVEAFPAVQSVSVDADLPHKLLISVREHRPVAALASRDGRRVAVASDGTLLPAEKDASLPAVKVDSLPDDGRLESSAAEGLVRVLAGAPEELRPLLARAYRTRDGVRVAFEQGPILRFGTPLRMAAKWAAATRVLADDSAAGAEAIDLRIPERPTAAFPAGGAGQSVGAHSEVQDAAMIAVQQATPTPVPPAAAPPEPASAGP